MLPSNTDYMFSHYQFLLRPGTVAERKPNDERHYLDTVIRAAAAPVPTMGARDWYESLLDDGPGQNDPLFDWLATTADMEQMRWFLGQEAAGEAGFGDLVALASIGMPDRVKLEMARNYWDEMGRGKADGMHDRLLRSVAEYLRVEEVVPPAKVRPEPKLLANVMAGFAFSRRHAFYAVGALGVVEMTAPGRVAKVAQGLERLGVPGSVRQYFDLHAVLDVKHSREWNAEVIDTLTPGELREAAEGAYVRLWAGARCFAAYRMYLGVGLPEYVV